jgi:voltage-gated potassium channel
VTNWHNESVECDVSAHNGVQNSAGVLTFTHCRPISYTTAVLSRRLLFLIILPALLIVTGTIGYGVLEGWSLFDALYMTVITLTTVGYGETHPLTTPGRVFTIILLLGGVSALVYAGTEVIRSIVTGEMQKALGKRLMERNLAELKDHFIVCGLGRMGRRVCREFSVGHLPFVVIDSEPKALHRFEMPHGISLLGDATNDEVLRHAGIRKAKALVTVVASDADNLYITMSARLLNEKLFIVARADTEAAEQKLIRAGANRVVSPYAIGGFRVAQAVLRPTVVDFIELATAAEHLELQMEEAQISSRSSLAGTTLKDSRLRQDQGVIIVAIKRRSGHMLFNPPADAVMEAGDILITLGHRKQLDHLDMLASGDTK